MIVACDFNDCEYCNDGECTREYVNIELELTASGFLPICQNYEEKEDPEA